MRTIDLTHNDIKYVFIEPLGRMEFDSQQIFNRLLSIEGFYEEGDKALSNMIIAFASAITQLDRDKSDKEALEIIPPVSASAEELEDIFYDLTETNKHGNLLWSIDRALIKLEVSPPDKDLAPTVDPKE